MNYVIFKNTDCWAHSRVPSSVDWDLKMSISNKFPGDTDATGPGAIYLHYFSSTLLSACLWFHGFLT